MQIFNNIETKKSKPNNTSSQILTFKGKVSTQEAIRLLAPAISNDSFSKGVAEALTDKNITHEKIYQVYLNGVQGLKHVSESITGTMAQLSFLIPSNKKTEPMLKKGAEEIKRLSAEQSKGNGKIKISEKSEIKTKDEALELLMPVIKLNDVKIQKDIEEYCSIPYGSPRSPLVKLVLKGLDKSNTDKNPTHIAAWMQALTKATYHSSNPEHDIKLIDEHFKGDKEKSGRLLLDIVTTHLFGKTHEEIPKNAQTRPITHETYDTTEKYITTAIKNLHYKNEEHIITSLNGTNMAQKDFNKFLHIAKAVFNNGNQAFAKARPDSLNGYYANHLALSIMETLQKVSPSRSKPLPGFEKNFKSIDFKEADELMPIISKRQKIYDQRDAANRADDD